MKRFAQIQLYLQESFVFPASDLSCTTPASTCIPCLSLTVPRSCGSDSASLFTRVWSDALQLVSPVPGVRQPWSLTEGVPHVLAWSRGFSKVWGEEGGSAHLPRRFWGVRSLFRKNWQGRESRGGLEVFGHPWRRPSHRRRRHGEREQRDSSVVVAPSRSPQPCRSRALLLHAACR